MASLNSGIQDFKNALTRAKAENKNPNAKFPQYSSGARAYIVVKGQPLAVCLDMSWSITQDATEIRSIDTQLPWDISIDQIRINANLRQIIDPDTSAETQAIFSTMAASIHQPFITLEVYDKLGARLFYAKGMFTSLSSSLTVGGLSTRSVNFVGVTYAHNVNQIFTPYSDNPLNSVSGAINKITKGLGKFGL